MKTTNIYVVLYKGTECYVGYSNNIKVRWREFRYAYNNPKLPSHNEKLIQHIVKYGWYNFSIEVGILGNTHWFMVLFKARRK